MVSSIPISLSGLQASQKQLLASASNIANLRNSGQNPASTVDGKTNAYNPLKTVQQSQTLLTQSLPNGIGTGVTSTILEKEDGTTVIYDPSSSFADENGLIAIPNISLEEELLSSITAEITYKANIFALKIGLEIEKSLIDELA